MNLANIEWDNVPPENAFRTTFHTEAHVEHPGQTHTRADLQGPLQQDAYSQVPFQEQPGFLAESQVYYVKYRSGYAMTGQGQVHNAAQAGMAGSGQVYRPDQARLSRSGRTVDQHHGFSQHTPQFYDEIPLGQGFLPPNSAAATHSTQYMMQPGNNPQAPSYQKAEFTQPNRGLHQPSHAGNLDVTTSSQGQRFTQPTSSDLEESPGASVSELRHLPKSNASHTGSRPSATPSQAKRGQNRHLRQQTPEFPDSEGSGSTVDSAGDGEWGESARNKKRQRLESKPATSKASIIKQSKKRDVKRTSNVVRHQFQQSRTHALLQDTNGNAVHSAVFGIYELAGEQGYCERNRAPEIYRRNNMRALQCHYTLTSTSTTSDGLLFVGDPATGKRHLVTSMTFRISGVTSENEREDLPILESDNKRSKWTPTGPKRNVLPHIPPMSDGTVANGATRFHKSVGTGNESPKSTHYEWSHLQFQAGTKHNGVRRTTQMFQFMRLSLIAEWGKGEHDRTKVTSCAGQKYIVFARSPGGRKTLTKDDKEESEATKRKSQSRQPQGSTASPGPDIESGTAPREHNRRGPKAGKRKRRRRDDSTPPPTPKAEPESDSEPLIGRKRRKAVQAGRTPRDILHLPPFTQEQEPIAATSLNEEGQQARKAEDQRADTPPADVSRELAAQELGIVSVAFYSPTDYGESSDFGCPDPQASTEPGQRSQLESHIDGADESDVSTFTEGPTASHGTTIDTSSHFDDAFWEELSSETEDFPEVKEDPDEEVNVKQDSPEAAGEMHAAEPHVLAGMGGNLGDESRVLRTSSMLPPPTSNLTDAGPPPSSTQDPSPASMLAPPDSAELEASHFALTHSMNSVRVPSHIQSSGFLMPQLATHDLSAPDISRAFSAIARAGSTAYDWEQFRQPQTINPSMLLRQETAGLDYDPSWEVDEDKLQEELRQLQYFWNQQL